MVHMCTHMGREYRGTSIHQNATHFTFVQVYHAYHSDRYVQMCIREYPMCIREYPMCVLVLVLSSFCKMCVLFIWWQWWDTLLDPITYIWWQWWDSWEQLYRRSTSHILAAEVGFFKTVVEESLATLHSTTKTSVCPTGGLNRWSTCWESYLARTIVDSCSDHWYCRELFSHPWWRNLSTKRWMWPPGWNG